MSEKIDIIIPTWNSMPELEKCLKSIQIAFPKEVLGEIMIVDKNSTDSTVETAKKYGCKILYNTESLGSARWDGLNAATSKWIAFIDSDIALPPNWYETMMKYHTSDKIGWIYGWTIDNFPHIHNNMLWLMATDNEGKPSTLKYKDRPYTNNSLVLRESMMKNIDIDYLKTMSAFEDAVLGQACQDSGYNIVKVPVPCVHLRLDTYSKWGKLCQDKWNLAGYMKHEGRTYGFLGHALWAVSGGMKGAIRYHDPYFFFLGLRKYFYRIQVFISSEQYTEIDRYKSRKG